MYTGCKQLLLTVTGCTLGVHSYYWVYTATAGCTLGVHSYCLVWLGIQWVNTGLHSYCWMWLGVHWVYTATAGCGLVYTECTQLLLGVAE